MSAEIKRAISSDFQALIGEDWRISLDSLPLANQERLVHYGLSGLELVLLLVRDSVHAKAESVPEAEQIVCIKDNVYPSHPLF